MPAARNDRGRIPSGKRVFAGRAGSSPPSSSQVATVTTIGTGKLADIDPANDPTVNPNFGGAQSLGPWASYAAPGGPYSFLRTVYADGGVVFDPVRRKVLRYAGAGHVATNYCATFEWDVVSGQLSWLTKAPPTDGLRSVSTPSLTRAGMEAAYTNGQIDFDWMCWLGDSPAWGAFARPGEEFPIGGHGFALDLFLPASMMGNTNGALMNTATPSGSWDGFAEAHAGCHHIDLDTGKAARNANWIQTVTGRSSGWAWQVGDFAFSMAGVGQVNRTVIDRYHGPTKTWDTITSTNAITLVSFSPKAMVHEPSGLVLLLRNADASGNRVAFNVPTTTWVLFAAPYAAMIAGTPFSWTQINLTADKWPVKADGWIEQNGMVMARDNWRAYGIDGKDGTTDLYVMDSPPGAATQQDYLTGTWHISVEPMQPLACKNAINGPNDTELHSMLVCDDVGGQLIYVPQYAQSPLQSIKPVGLKATIPDGPPAQAQAARTYRDATTLLWQDTATKEVAARIPSTDRSSGPFVYDTDGRAQFGPSKRYVVGFHGWKWRRLDGGPDIIDASLVVNGSNHWATVPTNSGHNREYGANVTSAVQHIQANDRWNIWYLNIDTAARSLAGKHSSTPPRMVVRYASAPTVDVDFPCTFTGRTNLSDSPSACNTWFADTGAPIVVEFERPARAVVSATLYFTVTTQWAGNGNILIDICDPPLNTGGANAPGLAAQYGDLDSGLEAHPDIVFVQQYEDASPTSKYLSNVSSWGFDDQKMSPEFWGGPPDLNKFPHLEFGKWVNRENNGGNLDIQRSTDTDFNFKPIAAGLGALRSVIVARPGYDDGVYAGQNGTTGTSARLFMPANLSGEETHINIRYYIRFAHKKGDKINSVDRKQVYGSNGTTDTSLTAVRWTDFSGKCGITPDFQTNYGGVSRTSGMGFGWTNRSEWILGIADRDGPDDQRIAIGQHWYDYIDNVPDPAYKYGNQWNGEFRWGQMGGRGSGLEFDRWYCVEQELKVNTVTDAAPGFIPDGISRVWVDGELVFEKTGLMIAAKPFYYDPQFGVPPQAGACTLYRNAGPRSLFFNWFFGGRSQSPFDIAHYAAGLVVSRGGKYIGPMKGVTLDDAPTAAPAWKPADGQAAVISHAYQAHPTAGKAATLAEIDPVTQPWYPSPAPPNLWQTGAWGNTTAYCGMAWSEDNREFYAYGSGHSGPNVTATFAASVDTLEWKWIDTPLPTDGLYKAATLAGAANFTDANIQAAYTQGEVTPGWQEWNGSSAAWGALAQPGKIWPTPQHTYAHQVVIPGSVWGNTRGAFISLSSGAARYETTDNRWSHYQDLDTGLWHRMANKRLSGVAVGTGGSVYYPAPINRLFCVSSESGTSAGTNTGGFVSGVDILNPTTKTWTLTNLTSQILCSYGGGLMAHTTSGLLILAAPFTPEGALSYVGTVFRFYAATASEVVAGTHTWVQLNVTASTWPVKSDGNLQMVGWSNPDASGRCWATDGKHGSRKLWALTPPAGATTAAQYKSGTWTVDEKTFGGDSIQTFTSSGSARAGMFSINNRLVYDGVSKCLLLTGDGSRDPILAINTQGL